MPISLEGTVGGRDLEARGEARGLTRGESRVLTSLLRRQFAGQAADADLQALAARLAERHHDAAVDLILSATSLDELHRTT